MTAWLWRILVEAKPCRPYNIGSDQPIQILELAKKIAGMCEVQCQVNRAGSSTVYLPVSRYVPSVHRARTELGLEQTISLEETIRKTIKFYDRRGIRS